ncbi:radical SAM/SPASM domain-containing protein [Actinacidiphila acididurans]|uniref:Radical SAM protein n=1 Tax=Actinacidiphila acididurans TaxID=2784346 RepID=A0ABS2TZJ7_9ACTN|nr:radical SAM protein [Actinacidiphila acididurans]MBM9508761.1 radical SAM protein [Actinacidiphila acididurans]
MTTAALSATGSRTRLLWLDLTRSCQLQCRHCYNGSGPKGGHGAMTREDWASVLDQAAGLGITHVQFIGGEPTLHPDFPDLVGHALDLGLHAEVYSNRVHVSEQCWSLFRRERVSVATSYYSDRAEEHNAVNGRPSHRRTRANIERAVRLGVPLRVGIIGADDERTRAARRDLQDLGVTRIGVDHVRPFGRGAHGHAPDMADLCGGCGRGTAAIGPDGTVSPCVFSSFLDVGNVRERPLADILGGDQMRQATAAMGSVARSGACEPDEECSPGYPGTECNPRN